MGNGNLNGSGQDGTLRTPAQVREHLRANGITITAFARQHGLSRNSINGVLRGTTKGTYGEAHRAAVALGLKPAPDSCTKPPAANMEPQP